MVLIYADGEARSGNTVPYHRQNANAGYIRHYTNYLYLQFVQRNSDRGHERNQAAKELTVCERKLKYWRQHTNFVQSEVLPQIERLKKEWAGTHVR